MILWVTDHVPVKKITQKTIAQHQYHSPLLERMEALGIISRERSQEDERIVVIALTAKGIELQNQAANIPHKLVENLTANIRV